MILLPEGGLVKKSAHAFSVMSQCLGSFKSENLHSDVRRDVVM